MHEKACIVLLAEQGKLSLDNTLKQHFPDFPAYAEKITIRHLLNHTSGIRDYLQIAYLKGLGDDDFYLDENIMEWLVNQSDLNFTPGEEYLYSNSGYWLLGQIEGKKAMKCRIADIDKFAFPLGVARFQRTNGAIVGFELDSGRVKNLKFRKNK